MVGIITGREVVAHFALIWREFGLLCLVRCVRACVNRRRTTFLDIVFDPRKLP